MEPGQPFLAQTAHTSIWPGTVGDFLGSMSLPYDSITTEPSGCGRNASNGLVQMGQVMLRIPVIIGSPEFNPMPGPRSVGPDPLQHGQQLQPVLR